MIIRKPYAFLIKNFKKIHVFMLILSLFVLYALFDISRFVNEFMRLGIYDSYRNPITMHITWYLLLFIFLIVVSNVALILLLRHKKKPWKIYLVPFVEYFVLFFVLNIIKGFFTGFTYDVETTDLQMSRDLLFIFQAFQLPAIAIFIMRVFGLDIKKFSFNTDEEFFELSEKDREEIEISIDIDHNSFIRLFKKIIRHLSYFYEEHKLLCRVFFGIVCIICLFNGFKSVFITNKVYKQGNNYSADGFTFKVNKAYYLDKGLDGDVVSKQSNFIVLDITATNHSAQRKIYMENFHLKNADKDYITTKKTYYKEFSDYGKIYESVKELKRDETANFIIIYKVDNKLKKNRFVLFYQEKSGYLRKIKLKLTDITGEIKDGKKLKLNDEFSFMYKGNDISVSYDNYEILDRVTYSVRHCTVEGCTFNGYDYNVPDGKKLLVLSMISDDFEGKDMVDFSIDYGKIVYKDSKGVEEEVGFVYPFSKTATGKYVYALVPDEIDGATKIDIIYTIRNDRYVYSLK